MEESVAVPRNSSFRASRHAAWGLEAVRSRAKARIASEPMASGNVLEVPQEILDAAHLTLPELKTEMALHLYAQGRLALGKARELAGLSLWEFRQLLAARRIPPHFSEAELQQDVSTLRELGRL
jgi:predicted HTH domain antitoxin